MASAMNRKKTDRAERLYELKHFTKLMEDCKMISPESMHKYKEVFGTRCVYHEPGYGEVWVKDAETGKAYISPIDETDEIFLDRINRSIKAGRNLFYEEWKRLIYKPDCLY